ncbi:hypothetical protein D0859_00225 [Hortaea werneckii]|uniref:Zn(2)-C6 fungal-type domain-containing protein n=1 Tax=Hortaea werneckii TaxID=91943 RepID=A0A3M7JCP2_HORWE|nr:hypothetical protein D0859_00225 [Hortaea werneckii]
MEQQLALTQPPVAPSASTLGLNDQSCNECRRRKGRCDRQLPECGPCARNKRHCLYERHSKTPLTRKHLTSVEEKLRQAEMRVRQMERRAQMAEASLAHQSSQSMPVKDWEHAPGAKSGERTTATGNLAPPPTQTSNPAREGIWTPTELNNSPHLTSCPEFPSLWQYVDEEFDSDQQIVTSPVLPEVSNNEPHVMPHEFEAPPSETDDFSWDEQSSADHFESHHIPEASELEDEPNVADGMASLRIDTEGGSGYLGMASGAAMLRLLLPDAEHRGQRASHGHQRTASSFEPSSGVDRGYVPTPVFETRRIGEIDLDAAIDSYFAVYHLSYPIVHEPTFRAQYMQVIPRPSGRSWYALAYMLGAIGLFTTATGHVTRDLDLFEAAKANISIGSLESGNLPLVQVLVLMSNYLQKRNKPNSGYNYLGLALHMAMGLGLHKEFQNWRITPLAMEIRRRVWWCLQVFAVGAMVTFGRPLSWPAHGIEVGLPLNVDDRDLTNVSPSLPPAKSGITTYSAVAAQARFHLATNDIYTKVISVNFPTASELLQLDEQRIEAWRLLWHNDQQTVPPKYRLSRSIMEWRFRNFRIIMYRPFVIRNVLQQRAGKPTVNPESPTGTAISRCLHEAHQSITSICSFWDSNEHNRMAAWYALYFLFQASLIPIMSLRNNPSSEMASSWRDQIHTVIRILDSMMTVNPSSKECRLVILRLCGDFLHISTDPGTFDESLGLHPVEESPQTQLSGVYAMMWPSASPALDTDMTMPDDSWVDFFASTQPGSTLLGDEYPLDEAR